jgi:hypothetical protein
MKRVIFAVVLLALAAPLTAQITFQRTYGGTDREYGFSVTQTADGGYVIAGWTESFGAGGGDGWLIKTDASGDTIWTQIYGGTRYDAGKSVAQTTDGGYVIAGWTESFGAGARDLWLIKTDAAGDTVWTRTYGGTNEDYGYSVAQTTDGGYIITGYTESFGAGRADVWLIKTDASGDTVWTHTYGGTDTDRGESVQQTADGGYIIAGHTWSFGAGSYDFYLVRTNTLGDTVWTRTFGDTAADWGKSVVQTADSGYVIIGWTRSFGAGECDVYLVKTNTNGDTMWTRTFGGPDLDCGYSVLQSADGGYVIAGGTRSFGAGGGDVYLVKTNANGDIIWNRTYGGTNFDDGLSVAHTADGGYAIAGYTESFGAGEEDIWLIKTDSAGNATAIAEPESPVTHKPAPATIARAVLYVPGTSGVLLDISGREVAKLHPGDNDVRHLSPGVYFVRPVGTVPASGIPGDSPFRAKVILTR